MVLRAMEMTFKYRFESAHRFLGSSSPKCQTPHGHTWWVEYSFARCDINLDSEGMLAEFGAVKAWLKSWVEEVLDHSFFHHWEDPIVGAMRTSIANFRGLPFPEDPTTEWIAYLISRKVRTHLKAQGDVAPLNLIQLTGIRIEETPTNSVVWRSALDSPLDDVLGPRLSAYRGWWDTADLKSRHLERHRDDGKTVARER